MPTLRSSRTYCSTWGRRRGYGIPQGKSKTSSMEGEKLSLPIDSLPSKVLGLLDFELFQFSPFDFRLLDYRLLDFDTLYFRFLGFKTLDCKS